MKKYIYFFCFWFWYKISLQNWLGRLSNIFSLIESQPGVNEMNRIELDTVKYLMKRVRSCFNEIFGSWGSGKWNELKEYWNLKQE